MAQGPRHHSPRAWDCGVALTIRHQLVPRGCVARSGDALGNTLIRIRKAAVGHYRGVKSYKKHSSGVVVLLIDAVVTVV